jgi:hypothetical protein
MNRERIHNVSFTLVSVFSFAALVAAVTGLAQPPQPDEGTGAHIFQIAMAIVAASLLGFLATADWSQPSRVLRRLALPGMALVIALAAVFYLEHRR